MMATFRTRKNKDGSKSVMARGLFPTRTFRGPRALSDAKLYAAEEERKTRLGEHYVADPVKFGALLAAHIARKKDGWADSTIRTTEAVRKALTPLQGYHTFELSRGMLERVIADKARTAPRVAQMALKLAQAVLREAMYDKHRVDMAVFGIPTPKHTPRKGQFLTMEQVRELASYAPENIYRIILVAALTGMRQGELLALKETDLHLADDTPYLEVTHGKTVNAQRRVYLTADAAKLLREQLLVRRHSDYVFPRKDGRAWAGVKFMEYVFVPAREAAGLTCTFHDLRHTFVSWAASEGMNREVVAELAGWSQQTVDKMFAIYRHVSEEEIASAVQQLSKAMEQ